MRLKRRYKTQTYTYGKNDLSVKYNVNFWQKSEVFYNNCKKSTTI